MQTAAEKNLRCMLHKSKENGKEFVLCRKVVGDNSKEFPENFYK